MPLPHLTIILPCGMAALPIAIPKRLRAYCRALCTASRYTDRVHHRHSLHAMHTNSTVCYLTEILHRVLGLSAHINLKMQVWTG